MVVFFLALGRAKELTGGPELTRVVERAAYTPVAQALSPHLQPRVFFSFAGHVLLATVFSSCCPELGRACQVMACHAGKMKRWIRQKKRGKAAESQEQINAGLVKPHICRDKNTAKYTLSKSFNTIYFMLK